MHRLGAVTLSLAIAFAATNASAQSTPEAQAEARLEMRQALEDLDAGKHEGALAHCKKAIALVPEANLPHKYAAKALEGLARWEEAVVEYETYLRIKADVSDAGAVRARIDEIRQKHLVGTVKLSCLPRDVRVVEGLDEITLDPHGQVELVAGRHRLNVGATGHHARDIDVDVVAGTIVVPACVLDPISVSAEKPPGGPDLPPQKEEPQRPVTSRWWFWTGTAAVVTGAVITVFLLSSAGTEPPSTEGGNHRFP